MKAGAYAAAAAMLLAAGAHAQDDALGRKVFTELAQPPCALCHALQGAGATGAVGPSLDEVKPDKAHVSEVVRNGIGVMPAYEGKLTPQQIDAVAAYVARQAAR